MSTELAVVGIDVSKNKLDIVYLNEGKTYAKKAANTKAGFDELAEWLYRRKVRASHICMEATATYSEAVATYLHDAGYRVSIVNPARIKGFAQSELARTKTDKTDAALIARFCLALKPEPWEPDPREVRELKALVRRLESLIEMKNQEQNRLEQSEQIIHQQIREHIDYLDGEIKALRDAVSVHINDDPELKGRKDLLESIPGIGEATTGLILSEFSNIERFKSAKHLASFIGVAPRRKESGSSVRGRSRMSKIGSSRLRKALFMPALVALRYNEAFIELKKRLLEAGKPKMLIVGAAMRKLVHVIYGVLKSGQPFDAKRAMGA